MVNIGELRDKVNEIVPGVGKGVVDYTIKKLGINFNSTDQSEVKSCTQEIIKHIQTLYGTEKANTVKSSLSAFL